MGYHVVLSYISLRAFSPLVTAAIWGVGVFHFSGLTMAFRGDVLGIIR